MNGLLQQANTPAIGPANVEDRKQGKQRQFPEGTRKIFRQAGKQSDEGSAAAARRADSADRAYQRYATLEEPTPHPAHESTWTGYSPAAAASDTAWERQEDKVEQE